MGTAPDGVGAEGAVRGDLEIAVGEGALDVQGCGRVGSIGQHQPAAIECLAAGAETGEIDVIVKGGAGDGAEAAQASSLP